MKELIITTDNLTAEEVKKAGDSLNNYGQLVTDKKAVTSVGTFRTKPTDKGTVTIFTSVEVDLGQEFLSEMEAADMTCGEEQDAFDSDFFSHWADGYKRSVINRAGHEKVATDLGLKAPSKRAENEAKLKEKIYGEQVAKLVAHGMTEDQAKRIVYGN